VLRVLWKFIAGALLCLLATAAPASALTLQQIGGGFEKPIYVTSDPGDPDRLFVVERKGSVLLVEGDEVKPFATLPSSLVSCCEGERGLLSIALAPDFAQSGRLFLFYTGKEEPGEIHIAEMVAGGDTAPLSSLRNLLTIPHPGEWNHHGGQLQFGPDGALYASTGDGGGANDPHHNAQDPDSRLGKILRLTPLAATQSTTVWSLGLRNPFRFSFDRASGDLWIGDVGQDLREEIDRAAAPGLGAGANFGWNCREGFEPGPATDPECATLPLGSFVPPVFEYANAPDPEDGSAWGCAVIGGYVARGPGIGDLFGRYVYGDFCAGDIRSFSPLAPFATDRYEGAHVASLNSFGEDSCGRLYAVSGAGPVYRLVGSAPAVCTAPPGTGTGTRPPAATPLAPKAVVPPPLAPSFVGVRALRRQVERNRRAMITAWVSPCAGRVGDPVTLWRGEVALGTRHLDTVCSARFRPRISRRAGFRVTAKADETYVAAISRRLTILPQRRQR
jgi:hypothetical protein